MWLLHTQQVQIGTEIFFWDAITNKTITTNVVYGLHGSQIGEKATPDGYVDVKVIDVFIPFVGVTFVEITKDPTI
jgi:hypothetical protein